MQYNSLHTLFSNPCFYFKQGSMGKDRSKTNNASDGPQGVKFQTRKRVYVVQQPTRCTRSKKSTAQPDASMPASDNIAVLPSTTTFETFDNFADRTQPGAAAEGEF